MGGGSTSQSSDGGDWADSGPHREMAVDVPDTFVGRTKTPPRYPPPKPAVVAAPVNNNTSPGLRKKVVTAQATQIASATANGTANKPAGHLRVEDEPRLVVGQHPTQQVCYTRLAQRCNKGKTGKESRMEIRRTVAICMSNARG